MSLLSHQNNKSVSIYSLAVSIEYSVVSTYIIMNCVTSFLKNMYWFLPGLLLRVNNSDNIHYKLFIFSIWGHLECCLFRTYSPLRLSYSLRDPDIFTSSSIYSHQSYSKQTFHLHFCLLKSHHPPRPTWSDTSFITSFQELSFNVDDFPLDFPLQMLSLVNWLCSV